jgi:YidC/Oxa1 family membrane protein insertase
MDIKRVGLLIATAVVGFLLVMKWHQDYPANGTSHSNGGNVQHNKKKSSPKAKSDSDAGQPSHQGSRSGPRLKPITFKTDTLGLSISPNNAEIVRAELLKYPVKLDDQQPVVILCTGENCKGLYTLNNKLYGSKDDSDDLSLLNLKYSEESQTATSLVLKATTPTGQQVTKTFTFTPNDYSVKVSTQINNLTATAWTAQFARSITRSNPGKDKHFNGASYSTDKESYEKLDYSDMDKKSLSIKSPSGWVAMQQHYFLSAWIPEQKNLQSIYTAKHDYRGDSLYEIGTKSKPVTIDAHKKYTYSSTFYVGPENTMVLAGLAKNLNLTVNYGWFAVISKFLFYILNHIHSVVGNWGWSIILITILIKCVLYYPSAKSYRSMARMRDLSPKLKSLQERHKDDRQALSQATMGLYKKEKVNPLGGCLPILVQLPIFIALYHLLGASVELRQAPFIFWIKDLSVKDPYWVLPILMGASMLLQQQLSPKPADPMQAKMMMLLPVVMTIVFLNFSAGLVLYWLTNNLISVAQQAYIMKTFNVKEADRKQRYKDREKRKKK